MKINVQKLTENAVMPKFAYDTDAGADLTATSIEFKDDLVIYGTGLAFEIPKGYFMQLYPRSSVMKYDLELTNCVGVVDADYRGEVKFTYRCIHDTTQLSKNYHNPLVKLDFPKIYDVGDRIGQAIIRKLVPTEYEEVDTLEDSVRGIGGWGSTGI